MAGDLSEKTEAQSHHSRHSSHGESTDEHESTRKKHGEGHADALSTPSEEHNLAKLDSKRAVEVKDEDIYSHLPAAEKEILKRQVDVPDVASGWKTLYRYSTTNDIIIMVISGICAIAAGAALPLMTVIFGNLAGEFNTFFAHTTTRAEFNHSIAHMCL